MRLPPCFSFAWTPLRMRFIISILRLHPPNLLVAFGVGAPFHPFLGVDSFPFLSAIVLFKNQPFPQSFWWLSGKKDPLDQWWFLVAFWWFFPGLRMEMEVTPKPMAFAVHPGVHVPGTAWSARLCFRAWIVTRRSGSPRPSGGRFGPEKMGVSLFKVGPPQVSKKEKKKCSCPLASLGKDPLVVGVPSKTDNPIGGRLPA